MKIVNNKFYTKWITSKSQLAAFQCCVAAKLGDDSLIPLINAKIAPRL
tara:strand:+ start:450 stop:593 length:144 start_codon:yes stop_codon:yes gene_type:complete